MKMWFLPFCLVLVFNVQWISCKCQFDQYDEEYPPVFTQRFDNTEMVLRPQRRSLDISEGASLMAYCDSNFSASAFKRSSYGSESSEGISAIEIKCIDDQLKSVYIHENQTKDVGDGVKLSCYGNQPSLYSDYSNNCPQGAKSLQYGLTIANRQVLLASLCYNYRSEEIVYVHYKSSEMSPELDDMSRGGSSMHPGRKTAINFVGSNQNRTNEINYYVRSFSGVFSNQDQFRFDHLVPIDLLTKTFPHQIDAIEGAISIPWWINLKEGNWKLFEEHLRREITVRDFEIYTGVASFQDMDEIIRIEEEERARQEAQRQADREAERRRLDELRKREEMTAANRTQHRPNTDAQPPLYSWNPHIRKFIRTRTIRSPSISGGYTDSVKYMSGSVVRDVPFYVWTYIKAANESDSTVVFAVNSPFVEASKFYYLDFCRETAFPVWLTNLLYTAKMPTLGYMFACRPHIIQRYLRMGVNPDEP